MKRLGFLLSFALLLSVPTRPLFAQRPAVAPAPTPAATDSTRQIRSASDTIPSSVQRNGIRVGTSVLTPDLPGGATPADTLRLSAKQQNQIHKIIPRQATIRSVILPGLGQAYNRQYYKIPFIYGGFGAFGYFFLRYRGLAKEAENGYRLLLYGPYIGPAQTIEPTSIGLPQTAANTALIHIPARYGDKPTEVIIGNNVFRTTSGAKAAYDLYRRYRDLNILLSVVLYAVNIVEANVAAHLKTFDLSDDISMQVEPNVIPMPGTGLVPGVRVALTFK